MLGFDGQKDVCNKSQCVYTDSTNKCLATCKSIIAGETECNAHSNSLASCEWFCIGQTCSCGNKVEVTCKGYVTKQLCDGHAKDLECSWIGNSCIVTPNGGLKCTNFDTQIFCDAQTVGTDQCIWDGSASKGLVAATNGCLTKKDAKCEDYKSKDRCDLQSPAQDGACFWDGLACDLASKLTKK